MTAMILRGRRWIALRCADVVLSSSWQRWMEEEDCKRQAASSAFLHSPLSLHELPAPPPSNQESGCVDLHVSSSSETSEIVAIRSDTKYALRRYIRRDKSFADDANANKQATASLFKAPLPRAVHVRRMHEKDHVQLLNKDPHSRS